MKNDRTNEAYLLSLLRAALNGETPEEAPEGVDLETVFRLAEFHDVANTAFYAVERLKKPPEAGLMKRWSEVRDRAIVKDLIQREEFSAIGEAFAAAGIRYVPLKGLLLKQEYPQSDLRLMTDLDILIDEEKRKVAGEIMLSLGYRREDSDNVEDTYYKDPVMNVELHYSLMLSGFSEEYQRLFDAPWGYTVEGAGAEKRFRDDYFFAYILAHAMKHYENSGTGIRSFMDFYIYEKRKPEIAAKALELFREPRIRGLAEDCMRLSRLWFAGAEDDGSLAEMEKFVLSSGTYGSYMNGTEYRIKHGGKAAYLRYLIFPPLEMMKNYFPVLNKAPVLLPFCWVARICTRPFRFPKENLEKLKTFLKAK
ncbi:MAG: nucleotidyltransferase family protein [Bacteroides sp.]|nr:nucleotidyltransferase family protein [Eubacterium sp.]MCM1418082.1 nucleotidyltransferase family protein [Roseburia sp.]MCM1462226.1 nucleotidyltransferase family protein [Bacteroides sp.]